MIEGRLHKAVMGFSILACAGLILISAGANYRLGASFGRSDWDAFLYGGGAALADVLKASLLALTGWAMTARKWGAVVAGCVLWVICVVFSLTSALGFLSLNRADTISKRGMLSGQITSLQAEQNRLRERLGWYPKHRPVAVVEGEMEPLEQNEIWRRTDACRSATLAASIAFCKRYARLRAERALGKEVRNIERRLRDIRNELKTVGSKNVVSDSDPQAALLSRLLRFEIHEVQDGLIILMGLLLEAASSLGLFVVLSLLRPWKENSKSSFELFRKPGKHSDSQTRALARPLVLPSRKVAEGSNNLFLVKNFLRRKTRCYAGSAIGATDLYQTFLADQRPSNISEMSQRKFGEIMSQLGHTGKSRCKLTRRIQYRGLNWKA